MATTTPSPSSATSPAIPSCASPRAARPMATFGLAVNRRWQNARTASGRSRRRSSTSCAGRQMGENVGRVAAEGRPRRRHRPPRAAVVGDPGRREALEDRDHRRRDRPEPALGHAPRSRRTTAASRRRRRRRSAGRRSGAAPTSRPSRPTTTTRSRSDGQGSTKRDARTRTTLAEQEEDRASSSRRSVEYVDYKDVNLLRRFMSDRAKIRARRVTGNDAQQQREVARAIKNAREMALLPYTNRVTTQRTVARRGDRGRRGRADGPPPRRRRSAAAVRRRRRDRRRRRVGWRAALRRPARRRSRGR